MKSSLHLFLAAILLTISSGDDDIVKSGVNYGNANLYVDTILLKVNRNLPDKIPLPDIKGPFNMHDCYFFGTENGIHRYGDATFLLDGRTTKFSSQFKMEKIGVKCKFRMLLVSGSVTSKTDFVSIISSIAERIEQGQHPWLTDFRLTHLDEIKIEIKGLTLLFNWLADCITQWIIGDIEPKISYVVEHQVKDLIQGILDQMVIP